ncbi:hypothetical protein OG216_27450 [Streptomycetaceae bacterium NBC_01309]
MSRLAELRTAKFKKKSLFVRALKDAARVRGWSIAEESSLDRMIRDWESGSRLSDTYVSLYCDVFGCTPMELGHFPADEVDEIEQDEALALKRELFAATATDVALVSLFEAQTENLRQMDRRLGAKALLPQSRAHVEQMANLLRHGVSHGARQLTAGALTEAAALAGWQALDLGQYREAWQMHETAKGAAYESDNPVILAHVTAQQAYVLLDLDQPREALELIQHAHERARAKLPALMRTWLYAAEAEAQAATGNESASRRTFDAATDVLPNDPSDPEMPFLFLAGSHLTRWRGNCLARIGADDAIEELYGAVEAMDPGFNRAEAGLRCDLAIALTARGEVEEARAQAEHAKQLAALTDSARQRRRINQVLNAS